MRDQIQQVQNFSLRPPPTAHRSPHGKERATGRDAEVIEREVERGQQEGGKAMKAKGDKAKQ